MLNSWQSYIFTQMEFSNSLEYIHKLLSRGNSNIQVNGMDFGFYRLGSNPGSDKY